MFWSDGIELTGFSGAFGGSLEVLTVGCNENSMLLTSKRDKVNPVRVDMGNTGLDICDCQRVEAVSGKDDYG